MSSRSSSPTSLGKALSSKLPGGRGFYIAPPSRGLEPVGNPARFTPLSPVRLEALGVNARAIEARNPRAAGKKDLLLVKAVFPVP